LQRYMHALSADAQKLIDYEKEAERYQKQLDTFADSKDSKKKRPVPPRNPFGRAKVLEIREERRLDVLLFEGGHCESREQGRRMILAGEVKVGGHVCDKPGQKISVEAEIELKAKPRYVGRGGLKMEGALQAFALDPSGLEALDIGASTGGFTDCLLQHGASKVYAYDVGTNQLAWKIRIDPRVVVREKFNARYMEPEHLVEDGQADGKVDLIVTDVSFISLSKILPAAFAVLREGGQIVALIKPQFELEKDEVGKGGIVREEALQEKAVEKIRQFVSIELGKKFAKVVDSPITGTDGNREFLSLLTHA